MSAFFILLPAWQIKMIERRYVKTSELRAKTGAALGIVGHAAVFNQLSEDLGGFREKIRPGAFADTIKTSDIRALWNHDANFVLARTKNNTLSLAEDNIGLAIDATLPDTGFARDLLKSIDRGDIDQMSFGFMVLPDGQTWRLEDGGLVRELIKVELFDVSPVTFPAYSQTDISVRSLAEEMQKKLAQASDDKQSLMAQEEFLARIKTRAQFIISCTAAPDPLSFTEILKKARMQTG